MAVMAMASDTAFMNQIGSSGRGLSRPRSRIGRALAGLMLLPLASCGAFGPGLAGLPSSEGWAPLPLRDWLIEAAFRPHTVVICRAETCPAPAMVAVFEAQGAEADAYARLLAHDPASLVRRPALADRRASGKAMLPARKPAHPGSTTLTERLVLGELEGLRITIRSKSPDSREANAVVLSRRNARSLTLVLAVTTDADNALAYAKAGMAGVW